MLARRRRGAPSSTQEHDEPVGVRSALLAEGDARVRPDRRHDPARATEHARDVARVVADARLPLEQRDAGKAQLAQDSGVGDYLAFVQSLYNEAEVVINQDALEEQDLLQ